MAIVPDDKNWTWVLARPCPDCGFEAAAVDVRELAVQPDDYLLLCSDGLTNAVPEATVSNAIARLRDPQRICDELVDLANRHGGPDNITVVVVAVIGSMWHSLSDWTRRLSGGHIAAADSAS